MLIDCKVDDYNVCNGYVNNDGDYDEDDDDGCYADV